MILNRDFTHNCWKRLIVASLVVLFSVMVDSQATESVAKADSNLTQTDVDRAKHSTDGAGVPILNIAGVGEVHHPAWVALYALGYAGIEAYDPHLRISKSPEKFKATIAWLEENIEQNDYGVWVWLYKFDSTYNDVSIKAPWSSAFAQAVGIQALLASYRTEGNAAALELAQKAAISLITPIEDGGLLFRSGNDIWFEEIPVTHEEPSHILNGHMRALLALRELSDLAPDPKITKFLNAGTETLLRWLPLYDAGYWLRYDLNPRKSDLLFRFANPYGFHNIPLAIDKLSLFDPVTGKAVYLDVGSEGDAEGGTRIAGLGWSLPEQVNGRSARRLVPSMLGRDSNDTGPNTYFYFQLPGIWNDNLRTDRFEIVIDYFDEERGNLTVQQRSIAPGTSFVNMRDGDLHLTGAGHWRQWRIPLRSTDLGYWVGISYAEKHKLYLEKISQWDRRFVSWAQVATGYANLGEAVDSGSLEFVRRADGRSNPVNTPVVPILSLDTNGVVMQHFADKNTRWHSDGTFDNTGGKGTPAYSPFLIAEQLIQGDKLAGAERFGLKHSDIERAPALEWLINPANHRNVCSASIYTYSFDNVYNDIETRAPWASAFGQAYVLKALRFAQNEGLREGLTPAILNAANAYGVTVNAGGITTFDKSNLPFYEEVPNATHVLNAHAVSVPEIAGAASDLKSEQVQKFADAGAQTLLERLHLFDTGYWLRYDQNPKKDLLFQLDWIQGESSPLIHEVIFENPQTNQAVVISAGQHGDFNGSSRLSGTDWLEAREVDGSHVRGFANGYLAHPTAVKGGTRHNTYIALAMPSSTFSDFFDVPVHRLTIRYKDVAKGKFDLKVQSINEGSSLKFIPLRGGLWETVGDNRWKEISVLVRPQDMGWYKGADYQEFEVKQLERIASQTNDWFFHQYSLRHKFFLEAQRSGAPIIIERQPTQKKNDLQLYILDSSPTYQDHGYEKSLDNDVNNDYTAGKEGYDQYVVIGLNRSKEVSAVSFIWESSGNLPKDIVIRSIMPNGELSENLIDKDANAVPGVLPLKGAKNVHSIRIDFKDFQGQQRILLRRIQIHVADGLDTKSTDLN